MEYFGYYLVMRLKEDDMVKISEEQLHDLFAALKATRIDVAGIVGLSPHAPSRWRKSGQISKMHLKRLGWELLNRLRSRNTPLTPVEQRAKAFIELVDVLDASGSAVPLSPQSPFYTPQAAPKKLEDQNFNSGVHDKNISGDLLLQCRPEQLVDALQKMGWVVTLSRKETK